MHYIFLVPLCVVLIACILPCADATTIFSAQDLIDLFNHVSGNALLVNIDIADDLDFSQTKLSQPLGTLPNGACIPYGGTLHGNGHTIKGLVIDNINQKKHNNAGLFCSMTLVRIDNLIIDSSCVFRGISAGALCVSATGSLALTNVTNEALVQGKSTVGGFIGDVKGLEGSRIQFHNCTNKGNVSGHQQIGGFIGWISQTVMLDIQFNNSVNNGLISGQDRETGGFVGGCSDNAQMTIVFFNVSNHASVSGGNMSGGIIGLIQKSKMIKIAINQSTNNGLIWNHNGNDKSQIGGMIGGIEDSQDLNISVSHSINNGGVDGCDCVGGVIGCIWMINNGVIVIENTMNNGTIRGNKHVGGLFGVVVEGIHTNVIMTNGTENEETNETGLTGGNDESMGIKIVISNSTNNGVVSQITHPIISSETNMSQTSVNNNDEIATRVGFGGFAGAIGGDNTNVTIRDSMNNGSISGNVGIGGFIGMIESSPQYSFKLSIINSVNKGNISATDDFACGLFCVNGTKNDNVNTTVMNSMNKGIVDGNIHGYGITDIITKANNVVSIGEVIGSSSAFTFWARSIDVDMVYCKQDNCRKDRSPVVLISYDTKKRFFCSADNHHSRIDTLLNEESERHQYGMLWTNELELAR